MQYNIFQPKRTTLSRDPNVVTNSQEEEDIARGNKIQFCLYHNNISDIICLQFMLASIIFTYYINDILQPYISRCKKPRHIAFKALHHIVRQLLKKVPVYILV